MAMLYVIGGFAVLGGLFWTLATAVAAPAPRAVVPSATSYVVGLVPPALAARSVTPGAVVDFKFATWTPKPPTATVSPMPTSTLWPSPTDRPSSTPTLTPTVTATWVERYLFQFYPYWPSVKARTASGLDWRSIDGAAACPPPWPMGTLLDTEDGRQYICIDAMPGGCSGRTCKVVVFTKEKAAIAAAWGRFRVP